MTVRFTVAIAVFAAVGMAVQPWYREIRRVTNFRPIIIDTAALGAQLDRLPGETTLLYLETDTTLNASLLLGGDRLGALTLQALRDSPALSQLIDERRPEVVVTPVAQVLNIDAEENRSSLAKRRNGFSFQRISHLLIVGRQSELGELHLWVRASRQGGRSLKIHDNPRSLQEPGPAQQISIQPGHTGWLQVRAGRSVRAVLIELPQGDGWIEGISVGRPRKHIRWPWTDGLQINFLLRDSVGNQFQFLPLSIPDLMRRAGAEPLQSLLRSNSTVLSCMDAPGVAREKLT